VLADTHPLPVAVQAWLLKAMLHNAYKSFLHEIEHFAACLFFLSVKMFKKGATALIGMQSEYNQ
jgi:hypothetical protein